MLDQNEECMCTFLFSSVVEQVFFCAAVRCGHALKLCDRVALLAVSADDMLHISARLVLPSARGAGFHGRLLFHGSVTENIHRQFEFISHSCHVKITERLRHTASTRSKGGHPMFGRSVCQLRAEQMTHTTCWVLIQRVSQWTKPFSLRNVVLFLQYPVFSSMNWSVHCNKIFARSLDCSGVVSHAMHCVLIGASAIQHAETVLVGLAP